ncbi:MAG: acyltransferase [Candidatus Hadarchaeum sp.]
MLKNLAYNALLMVTNRIVARIPSHAVRLWFYRSVMEFSIGRHSYILMDVWFDQRGRFSMGEGSVINERCRIDNRGGVRIGNGVSVSADVIILTADHDLRDRQFSSREREVVIGDCVFVGTRALILPGVTIGHGAAIGAGAVVTRDVPERAVVAGVPARQIGERPEGLDYRLNYGRPFH